MRALGFIVLVAASIAVLVFVLTEDEAGTPTVSPGDPATDVVASGDEATPDATAEGQTSGDADGDTDATEAAAPTPTPRPPYDGWVDPASSGEPYGSTVEGLLTFRGSPTRSYYGAGPVPTSPQILWSYPEGGQLCAESAVGSEVTTWCGTGWTGQPSVFEYDGRTWVAFGAYDRNVHFLDADTGKRWLPSFPTGDIIKGSVTIDPDGYPILYTGSRDNFLRAIAFDRSEPTELWSLSASAAGTQLWNDDWDGSPIVVDDYLFEGGENSVFHIVKLNRGYDDQGLVTVNPELVFAAPGWDQDLLNAVGNNVSIETSVAITGNTVYFANSGGLVQGWDITGLAEGVEPQRVFRWWIGDDTDATIVADDDGTLYVAAEYERANGRSNEVGQLVKLDPSRPDDPLVWSVFDNDVLPAGFWATPAIHGDMLYASTNGGRLMGIDKQTGEILWTKNLPGPLWSSQVVVDDVLIQGDCNGVLHAYDVSTPRVDPPELWTVEIGGCIESTPAVWDGMIFVGTRAGQVHAIGDPAAGAPATPSTPAPSGPDAEAEGQPADGT